RHADAQGVHRRDARPRRVAPRARGRAAAGASRDTGGGRLGRALPRNARGRVHHRRRAAGGRGVHRRMSERLANKVCVITGAGSRHETSEELWDRVMAVNVRGVFLVSKFVVPHMLERRAGSIINMSSTIADIGLAQRASYAASKGAILALTRAMQVDYAPFGIRVNALLPGTIHTPFVEKYLRESYPNREDGLKAIRKRQLTEELGKPEDVASAALFLASDESSFVMGTGLFVDGGVRGGK